MCELLMAREQRDESMQVQSWLRQIKESISNEAFRFSGYTQQVTGPTCFSYLSSLILLLKEEISKIYFSHNRAFFFFFFSFLSIDKIKT